MEQVERAQRLLGAAIVPRAGADPGVAGAAARAAYRGVLDLAGAGHPTAVDEIRRVAQDSTALGVLQIHPVELLVVLPVAWADHIVANQGFRVSTLRTIAEGGAEPPTRGHTLQVLLRSVSSRADRADFLWAIEQASKAGIDLRTLLADGGRWRRIGVTRSDVVASIGARGAAGIDGSWSVPELIAIWEGTVDQVLRSAAAGELIARSKAIDVGLLVDIASTVEQPLAGQAKLQAVSQAREALLPLALPPPGADERWQERADVALHLARQVVRRLGSVPPVSTWDISALHDGIVAAERAIARVEAMVLQREVQRCAGSPAHPFGQWRADLEHLCRRSARWAEGQPPSEERTGLLAALAAARDLGDGARFAEPVRTWSASADARATCAWCGAWAGFYWAFCGACGAPHRGAGSSR